jgi:hypothetical protein
MKTKGTLDPLLRNYGGDASERAARVHGVFHKAIAFNRLIVLSTVTISVSLVLCQLEPTQINANKYAKRRECVYSHRTPQLARTYGRAEKYDASWRKTSLPLTTNSEFIALSTILPERIAALIH